jgi:hypothetical protein
MFTFQSGSRSLDLQLSNKKVVEFRMWSFQTKDADLASLVREKLSNEIWEVEPILAKVKLDDKESVEEPEVVKPRRGRPPKSQVVQGMRTTAPIEEEGDSK